MKYAKILAELQSIQTEVNRIALDTSPTQDGARSLFDAYRKKHPETEKRVDDFFEPSEKSEKKDTNEVKSKIQERLDKHKGFLSKSKGERFTLRGISDSEIKGMDLSGIKIPKADLRSRNLSKVSFKDADLSGALFVDSVLTGANFSGANLNGADFSDADLEGVNLKGAKWNADTKWPDDFDPDKKPESGSFTDKVKSKFKKVFN